MSVGRVDPREDRDHDRRDTATRERAVTGRARGSTDRRDQAVHLRRCDRPGGARTGDEDDVAPAEAPTQAAPVAAPVAAAAARRSGRRRRPRRPTGPPASSFPKWVGLVAAAIVAALIFGGIGYAIGDSSDSGTTQNASNAFPNGNANGGQQLPGGGQFPGGQLPNGNGNGERRTATATATATARPPATPASSASACRPAPTPRASRSPTWPTTARRPRRACRTVT